MLDSGCAFWLKTPGSDPVSFLVHHIRVCDSVCPMAGDVNFGLLFQGVSDGVLRCPWCGCFAGWLLGGQGRRILCVPQLLACFFLQLNSHLLLFPFTMKFPENASPLLSTFVFLNSRLTRTASWCLDVLFFFFNRSVVEL